MQAGGVNQTYKATYRRLAYNLKDVSNPDLRRRVLSREIAGASAARRWQPVTCGGGRRCVPSSVCRAGQSAVCRYWACVPSLALTQLLSSRSCTGASGGAGQPKSRGRQQPRADRSGSASVYVQSARALWTRACMYLDDASGPGAVPGGAAAAAAPAGAMGAEQADALPGGWRQRDRAAARRWHPLRPPRPPPALPQARCWWSCRPRSWPATSAARPTAPYAGPRSRRRSAGST